jgi:hypothetical protein
LGGGFDVRSLQTMKAFLPGAQWPELHSNSGRCPTRQGWRRADPANPQRWNRYAYVMNTPLRAIDPSGLGLAPPTWDKAYHPLPDSEFGGLGGGDMSWVDYFFSAAYGGPAPTAAMIQGYEMRQFWGNQIYDLPGYENPGAQAEGQYNAQVAAAFGRDPCVYLNNAGTGVESIDQNSSPGECQGTGGQWIPPQPPGTVYGVGPNGNAYAQALQESWGKFLCRFSGSMGPQLEKVGALIVLTGQEELSVATIGVGAALDYGHDLLCP